MLLTRALAHAKSVEEALLVEWDRSNPDLPTRTDRADAAPDAAAVAQGPVSLVRPEE